MSTPPPIRCLIAAENILAPEIDAAVLGVVCTRPIEFSVLKTATATAEDLERARSGTFDFIIMHTPFVHDAVLAWLQEVGAARTTPLVLHALQREPGEIDRWWCETLQPAAVLSCPASVDAYRRVMQQLDIEVKAD